MKSSIPSACFILLLFLVSNSLPGQQGTYHNYQDHPWVDSVLATLSREEKIAQSLWVLAGPEEGLHENMEIVRAVLDAGLGGLIFTESPNGQMQELANYCSSLSSIPLAIALEGRWSDPYPDMISLAAIDSDSVRFLAGANLAAEIRKKGVDLILAEGMDDALAAGLTEKHIQILNPKWIQRARISEIAGYMEAPAPADSLEHRVRQALALKYWILQHKADPENTWLDKKNFAGSEQSALIRDLYARSLTVLKNQDEVIPVQDLGNTRIACLTVDQAGMSDFLDMAGLYTRTDNYVWSPESTKSKELAEQLASYNLLIVGLSPEQLHGESLTFLSSLKPQTKLIVVCFGDPAQPELSRSIASIEATLDPEGLILSYEQNPMTEGLSAQLIFGGIGGSGRLPLSIGDQYPAAFGITTPGGLRLQYGYPENAGLFSTQLNQNIDSIVKSGLDAGAYPGCQVIVARRGTVVFHKAYGYHTYDKRIEVRKNDLYDLASVTKVSGPLSGLMLLEASGKFSYRDHLGDYCAAMKGSDKADLALKDVLAHRAGLYPWIPYHEKTLKKNGQYKKRFIHPDPGGKYTLQIADRLYLSDRFRQKIFKVIRKSELGEQKYLYSGLSFFLFPTIIEELSGQPYETFLAEQIYQRLGAWELLYHPRSKFPASRIVPTEYDSLFRKQLVHGYVHDEGAALMGAHAGNAGLFASSNDLLKLIEMYRRMGAYGGEQIIPSEVLREYSSYQFPELKIRRGLGFDKPLLNDYDGTPRDYPCPGAPPSSFGHSGFTGTFVWADPENEISYVFLSNRVHTSRTNQLLYEMNIRTNILQSVYDSLIDP